MSPSTRRLARLIESSTGFVIRDRYLGALQAFARERASIGGHSSLDDYVSYLRRHPDSDEWRILLNRITIKESYLFRGQAQLDVLRDVVIKDLATRRGNTVLRVWSAGCAHGEEAVTLAIVLDQHPGLKGWDWNVLATDVDGHALEEARRGLYSRRAVARVPSELFDLYFATVGDRFELRPELRRRITYRHLNLVQPELDVAPGSFDIVFLRNVLIYFRPALQKQVVAAAARALAGDGSLFLGPSESLLHLDCDLRAHDLGTCFAYRHKSFPASETDKAGNGLEDGGAIVEPAIIRVKGPAPNPEAGSVTGFDGRIERVVAVLEAGTKLDEAIDHIDAIRHDFPENALTHLLEGIARERTGDMDAALEAYRAALYLEPDMDEVRFLLAEALAKVGKKQRAAREFRAVLSGLGSHPEPTAGLLARIGLPSRSLMAKRCLEYLR